MAQTSNPISSIADQFSQYSQGLLTSLQSIADTGLGAIQSAQKIRDALKNLQGKPVNNTTAQNQTSAFLEAQGIPQNVQNILVLTGIVSGAIGLIYLLRK